MGPNGTNRGFLPDRLELVRNARPADPRTVRLCIDEQQACCASKLLSRLTVREIAARMGRGKSTVDRWMKGEARVPESLLQAFCNATGTTLLHQFRELERAERESRGISRPSDVIAEIAAPTLRAWSNVA